MASAVTLIGPGLNNGDLDLVTQADQVLATPSDPWRIIPRSQWDKDKGLVLHSQDVGPDGIVVAPGRPLDAETTCYTIRAYVVARDSKNSDSTHPVGYSTCHPASRYRLKSAVGEDALVLQR